MDVTAQQLSLHRSSQAGARQNQLLAWAWKPEKGLATRLQRTRMRDSIKAESQSEAMIGLKLYLPREDALGLVRGSGYGQDLTDKDQGPTALGELLIGSQFLGARGKDFQEQKERSPRT